MKMTPQRPGLHILIADDDYQSYLNRFQNEFRGKAYVSAVDCGDLAVRLFDDHDYDIVVLDFDMPHDGLETGKEVRAMSDSVILVGYSESWDKKNSKKAGLNFFSGDEDEVIDYIHQTIEDLT